MTKTRKTTEAGTKRQAESGRKPEKSNGADLFNGASQITSLMGTGVVAMQNWLQTSQELGYFMAVRAGKDMAGMQKIATCRTPQEVSELWLGLASEAAHDYADEFDRLLSIGRPGA